MQDVSVIFWLKVEKWRTRGMQRANFGLIDITRL
jgi:hypothetical protein